MAVTTARSVGLLMGLSGMMRGWRNETVRTSIFIATIFVLYPLGILFKRSLYDYTTHAWTLSNYKTFFSEPDLVAAFWTTIKLAVGTSIFSLIVSVPMAWGGSRTDMPFRGFLRFMVVLTFATPSFLGAIGWIMLLGPRSGSLNLIYQWLFATEAPLFDIMSFGGMVFVLGFFHAPSSFFRSPRRSTTWTRATSSPLGFWVPAISGSCSP